jgi:periplasmic divalent cation tolerance protein
MQQNDKLVLVYATFPDQQSATATAEHLVQSRLAACVNILPGMVSIYEWDDQLNRADEVVAIVKTRAELAERVTATIKARHSYDNPAILILPVTGGSQPFLAWVTAQSATPKT